jgi:Ca-activated chloride channel family protein
MATVNREDIQQGVRDIEGLIRHYASRTTEFKNYIAQGPDYVDFVALPEYEMIPINQGKTEFKAPEKLVALYPKEGTFWHESPVCTLSADWVTPEQHDAAEVFTNYILTPAMQQIIMSRGFRPANPDVVLADPIIPENGISLKVNTSTLDVPAPEVVAAIQQSWSIVKKQADIMLLIDISGSMGDEGKIDQAKQATLAFLDRLESRNRVGLRVFSDSLQELVPLADFEGAKLQLRDNVNRLGANGGTALYGSLLDTVLKMNEDKDEDRIRAIVILSDGQDSGGSVALNEVVQAIQASRDALNPLIVIPVAYGGDADTQALNAIARASHTQMVVGDPKNILSVLNIISSYF